jgi:hypothetical protein
VKISSAPLDALEDAKPPSAEDLPALLEIAERILTSLEACVAALGAAEGRDQRSCRARAIR